MNTNSEVDINILVTLYNQRVAALTNQNILLEAKLQSFQQDYEKERNLLLKKIFDLEQTQQPKTRKKSEDYHQSGVE